MSELQLSITKSDDGKYVVMKCVGLIDPTVMLPKIIEAHAFGKEIGINRFLVDVTESRNQLSVY